MKCLEIRNGAHLYDALRFLLCEREFEKEETLERYFMERKGRGSAFRLPFISTGYYPIMSEPLSKLEEKQYFLLRNS